MSRKSTNYDPGNFTLYLADFRGNDWRWDIPVEDYLDCKRKRKPATDGYNYYRFVTPRDFNILTILDDLVNDIPTFEQTPRNIAQIIIEFTQHLPYQDKYQNWEDEFAKYPLETLCENGGDCVDMSIVAVSMLTARGIDSRFLSFDEHLAIAVNVPADGEYILSNGKRFYLADPVGSEFRDDASEWNIGDPIPDCSLWKAQLLPAYNPLWKKKIKS